MNDKILARKIFHKLVKGYYNNEYIVLNDNNFLAYIYAPNDADAIQKFESGIYKGGATC